MKKGFFDLISLNEARISALILSLFVLIGFGMYQYFTLGTLDNTVAELISTLFFVVGGVQATKQVSEKVAEVQVAKHSVSEFQKYNQNTQEEIK